MATYLVTGAAGFIGSNLCRTLADLGARVDVDAAEAVGVLGDDARDHRHLEAVQLVGDAVRRDGEHPGVAEDRLGRARCRRITLVGGDRVEGQLASDLGQPAEL